MKVLDITKGYQVRLDDEDYERVAQFKWQAHVRRRPDGSVRTIYASRVFVVDGKKTTQQLHQFILRTSSEVDHRDSDGLNNQKLNLRSANVVENQRNARKRAGTSSRFKGVHLDDKRHKWQVRIKVGDSRPHLGYFNPDPISEVTAGLTYDKFAGRLFGEYFRPNFPSMSSVFEAVSGGL